MRPDDQQVFKPVDQSPGVHGVDPDEVLEAISDRVPFQPPGGPIESLCRVRRGHGLVQVLPTTTQLVVGEAVGVWGTTLA